MSGVSAQQKIFQSDPGLWALPCLKTRLQSRNCCPCQHLDLNVQTCEKCASVVHKLPSLYVCVFCRVQLSATPWTAARQAPLFMEFPRQGCWRGLPFSPPGALPGPRVKPASLAAPAFAGVLFTTVHLGSQSMAFCYSSPKESRQPSTVTRRFLQSGRRGRTFLWEAHWRVHF